MNRSTRRHSVLRHLILALAVALFAGTALGGEEEAPRRRRRRGGDSAGSEEARMEMRANRMIDSAVELLEQNQEERGLKLIAQVPRMFPEAKARFRAFLVHGKYLVTKRRFDEAVKQFKNAADSEDADERAEAMYQEGICHYSMNSFDRAFMVLRRVTNEYPWSVFANEAYYYIGQCHFKLGRWAKSVEALKMVGTNVPTNITGESYAEAGQRMLVKIHDKDLVVLEKTGGAAHVAVATEGGDRERMQLEPLSQSGEDYIATVQTALGAATPGDGTLQIRGGDRAQVLYVDENTEGGKRNQKALANVRMVSTASIGFMDGAFKEYTSGVFGNQPAFLQVKDFDRDVSDKADTVTVRVKSEYLPEEEEDFTARGVLLDDEVVPETRDSFEIELTETGPHTGIFTGRIHPRIVAEGEEPVREPGTLFVQSNDKAVIEYTDEMHLDGEEPRDIGFVATVVVGDIPNVMVTEHIVTDPDIKAKKLLIEAEIYKQLASIFKEVGLQSKADDKADEGLLRVDKVRGIRTEVSLDRTLVEQAYKLKWELLLVQNKLKEAISVCFDLTRIFPDTDMADQAFLQIANARIEAGDPQAALPILTSILRLPNSEMKAEAQFTIGKAQEEIAIEQAKKATEEAKRRGQKPVRPDLSRAMMAYKQCAEAHPASPFAGESLKRIVKYYITYKDYPRAIETLERIFQDYQDVDWLDDMLLYWGVSAYRMGDMDTAAQKFRQVLEQFPGGKAAEKAKTFLKSVNRRSQ